MIETQTIRLADEAAERDVAERLARGELVAVPTETVYGLAGDAADGKAVARIFEAKGRPRFNPLIAHVTGRAMAERYAEVDPLAARLIERFWPGPLTLVLPLRPDAPLHPLVTAGLPTVALRSPQGGMARVLAHLGRPVAAPSANRSGRVSPTTAAHVLRTLGGRIEAVADGGAATHGIESTIVQPCADHVLLLRPGSVTAAEIEAATGLAVRRHDGAAIVAPGQMRSHYAPHGRVRLAVAEPEPDEHYIAFGPLADETRARAVYQLSETGDLREAASRLFAALSAFDAPDIDRIAVAPIPAEGLGEAINDRLARAAADR
ncbi:threonylcarbamoyl-AMP synthase [Aureimonas flava]|uniref:Threonylcarbamoyl-AMP synthase n=1 Tax=Aureimonas flava TaxID=2320271 RepID=A0A3A1WPP6_9HYPH|nr:L-threonylcarbamoyladenylate synthase [Aureimonas flava]RIY03370.1 threonylcarbamoyl-AMP synthase [Aureimonas flava]